MLSYTTVLIMHLALYNTISQFDTELAGIFNTMQSIQSRNAQTFAKALRQLDTSEFRSAHIQKVLIQIVESCSADTTSSYSPRKVALHYLANNTDYRSDSKLINLFIKNINIRVPTKMFVRGLESPDNLYPSIRGLLRIGERATGPLLSNIMNTDDKNTLSLIAFWHYKYYGKRMALNYFYDVLDHAKLQPEERLRVVWVLEHIENHSW